MPLLDDLLNDCRDLRPLAEGGQKVVYRASHPEFGEVVVKHGEYRSATTLERITREVQLLRDLDSRYYPKQHQFLIEPLRREFLVIEEWLDATELTNVRDTFRKDEDIKNLLRHLVCALVLIWQRKVVHRDIKPANILITSNKEPRIIDLGIARFLDDTSLTATLAGHGPATMIYAAPEQLTNRD